MKFSVIIPLYNKAAQIERTLQSVFRQTFSEFEVIVVNDGSTDGSEIIVEQFQDARLKIIHQKNAGVSTARNNGVKHAKNPFIAFLDADDWWDENYLAEMKTLITKYKSAGIYGAKYRLFKHGVIKDANIGLDKSFTDGIINYFEVYAKTMIMPLTSSSVVVPKKLFDATHGFQKELKLGEDFDLWLRLALKYPVSFLNKSLVNYNQDVNANNRGANPNRLYDKNNHFIFQLDYLDEAEQANADLKLLLDRLRAKSLFRYYIANKYKKDTHRILNKIDFSKLPFLIRLNFKFPVVLVRIRFNLMKKLSAIKQFFICNNYFTIFHKTVSK